ncbi:MAG: nitrite/sulfite reductase [Acidimicrobiia bacterium]|nr:nitrite/sulfite reductase [Acidimicrobiia bacterium]
MSATDTTNTHGRTRLSFATVADIDEFVSTLERYERGELSADQWRAFRLVRGTYGQRQSYDASMLRVKVPQGVLDKAQLYALAAAGEKYSRTFGHITTRQNIQLHFIKLHDIEHAMRDLAASGLTTREACGNSVRNITGCPYAGVSATEVFDVTPYAEGLTRFFLRHPLAAILPRKFKIAFEGCAEDHIALPINDLGFKAALGPDGTRGFRITAGGGTAIMCTNAGKLHDFIPASEILRVGESVLKVFRQFGDFQHKQRNRMKFMIKSIGWDRFVAEYQRELAAAREANVPTLDIDPPAEETKPERSRPAPPAPPLIGARVAAAPPSGPGVTPVVVPVYQTTDEMYIRWRGTNVHPQKQFGYSIVTATVPLGDLTSEQMRVIGDLAEAYGDGSVRVTMEQDLVFRWVRVGEVHELYQRLAAAGLGLAEAATVADVTSCPGAESCRLAVTQSRGLGRLLEEHLRARPDLVAAADGARIKISGCPNGCGQHHVATIGFQGSVRKVGTRAVPQYFVLIGGGTTADGASFGRLAAKIPARRIPQAVERLINLYAIEKSANESAPTFFARVDLKRVQRELLDLQNFTEADAVPLDFVDLAETGEYTPEVMEGECSA